MTAHLQSKESVAEVLEGFLGGGMDHRGHGYSPQTPSECGVCYSSLSIPPLQLSPTAGARRVTVTSRELQKRAGAGQLLTAAYRVTLVPHPNSKHLLARFQWAGIQVWFTCFLPLAPA